MRLSVQLTALTTVATIAPLLLAGWYSTRTAIEHAETSSDEILLRDAQGIADFVDTWMTAQVDAIGGWTVPFRLGGDPALQDGLARAVLLAVPAADVVVLTDNDGFPLVEPKFVTEELVAAGDPRPLGDRVHAATLTKRLPVRDATEASPGSAFRTAIGAVSIDDGWPEVPIAAVGPHDDGVVLGVDVSLREVDRLVRAASSPTHMVAVLRADGEVLVGGGALIDPSAFQALLGSHTETTFKATVGEERVRGALAPIPVTGWLVAVVEPASVVEATSAEIQRSFLRIMVVSGILAIAVGVVVARTVSRPVGDLRDAAIAVGRGELSRRIGPTDRDDELGELVRAFDAMAGTLEANRAQITTQREEIEAFNRELQQRVDERTRELAQAQSRLVESGQLAAVAEISAGLAHELNNPLAAILGLTQVLRMRARGTPDEERLARIEEQAARCREVLAAMLRLSSGQPGEGERATVIDFGPVLREVVGLVAGPFRQRGVAVELVSVASELSVRIDPVTGSRILAQVLQSLRAGLSEGASAQIRAAGGPDGVEVEITTDRPIAEAAAKDDYLASSMGLWVAKRLLDDVGGRLVTEPSRWRVILPGAA